MKTDGSDYTVIAEGNYTNINATETDVYFRDFASGVMYKTPIADPVSYTHLDVYKRQVRISTEHFII